MTQDVVYVHLHDDRVWQVTHLSRVLGQFDVQSEAIRIAVESANRLGTRNCDGARVIMIDGTGNLDQMWICGHDRSPPGTVEKAPGVGRSDLQPTRRPAAAGHRRTS